MGQFEYRVAEVRRKPHAPAPNGEGLSEVLNRHAAQGWRLACIAVLRDGRAESADMLLVTFERELAES